MAVTAAVAVAAAITAAVMGGAKGDAGMGPDRWERYEIHVYSKILLKKNIRTYTFDLVLSNELSCI